MTRAAPKAKRAALALAAACALASGCMLSTEGQKASADPTTGAGGTATTGSGGHAAGARPDGGGEVCDNGVDDDGNGKVDCEDPACGGYECVEVPPEGWDGPYRIRDVPFDEPTKPCAGGAEPKRNPAGNAGTPGCSPCGCGAVEDARCTPPALHCYYGQAWCNAGGIDDDLTVAVNQTSCLGQPPVSGTSACAVTSVAGVGSEGKCAATGGTLAPSPTVERHVDQCGGPTHGGGCAQGRVCAPKPAAGYGEAGVCIVREGRFDACPVSFHDEKVAVWAHAVDDRGCSTCTCTPAGAACVGGYYTFFACNQVCDPNQSCQVPLPLVAGAGCANTSLYLDPNPWSVKAAPPTLTPGTCTSAGGEPSGGIALDGELTFCCKH